MLAKHITRQSVQKSSFKNLVRYITNDKGDDLRIGDITITNASEDLDLALAEIEAVQKQNITSNTDKTYHLLISFPEGDNPSTNTIRKIEEEYIRSLGFENHQRVSAIHRDTNNLHIHVAINKVNPDTFKNLSPYRDFKKLAETSRKVEVEYNLKLENQKDKKIEHQITNDLETKVGLNTFLNYLKTLDIEKADYKNWDDFHNTLASNGLNLEKKGAGFVITDGKNFAKASSVGISVSKLENKLGNVTLKEKEKIKGNYKPEAKHSNRKLFDQYKDEMSKIRQEKKLSLNEFNLKKIEQKNNKRKISLTAKTLSKLLPKKNRNALSKAMRLFRNISNKRNKRKNEKTKKLINKQYRVKSYKDWLIEKSLSGSKDALKELHKNRNPLNDAVTILNGRVRSHRLNNRGTYVKDSLMINSVVTNVDTVSDTRKKIVGLHAEIGALSITGDKENIKKILVASVNTNVIFKDANLNNIKKLLEEKSNVRSDRPKSSRRFDESINRGNRTGGSGRDRRSIESRSAVRHRNQTNNLSDVRTMSLVPSEERKAESILPSNAPNSLGRRIGTDNILFEAARKYIKDRNEQRDKIKTIKEHVPAPENIKGVFTNSGIRQFDDKFVILLESKETDKVYVKEISKKEAARIKRQGKGAALIIDGKSIKEQINNQTNNRSR